MPKRGQRLREGGAYFKLRGIYHIKFQNFVFVLFNNENVTKPQCQSTKKNENIKIPIIVPLIKCLCNHTI